MQISKYLAGSAAVVTLLGLLCAGGCPPQTFDNSLEPRLGEIAKVRDATDLTPEQKRAALAGMGLDPLTINAIMVAERTANQYGGDLRSAYEKAIGGRLDEMTPDEVQLYADGAAGVGSAYTSSLPDASAWTVVRFFNDNNVQTVADLKTLLANTATDIPSNIPDGFLSDVFVDFDSSLIKPLLP